MDGIEVVCTNCGRHFTVSEDLAGLAATCPRCEHQVAVPSSSGMRENRHRLQLRRGTPITGGRVCPACNAAMPADAVICVRCGFDTRTGTTWQTKQSYFAIWRRISPLLGVVILVGIVWTITKRWRESGSIGEPPVIKPQTAAQREVSPESSPTQSLVVSAPVPAQIQDVADTTTVATAQASDTATNVVAEAPAGPSKADIEIRLTQTLNARLPLYAHGAQAVLRQKNGLVHRGEIVVLGTNSVTLKTEMGIREIPFAVLDRDSRLRCDPDFRQRLIQARAEHDLKSSAH